MTKLMRLGIGVAAACAAGVLVYGYIRSRREVDEAAPEAEKPAGKLIMFPAERPPFAEAAQSQAE